MTTIHVKGQDVRVGDDLWVSGVPKRITRIERYIHQVVTRNEVWWSAMADTPERAYRAAWGITLEYNHGYAAHYEITLLPGDDRTDGTTRLPEDDYLDPFASTAARLWARYQVEGMPVGILWRPWIDSLPVSDMPGLFSHESGEDCYNLACFTGIRPS